ncbi:hypothetical protein DBR06_SOUSAS5010147, partial [Sousa chinensis]
KEFVPQKDLLTQLFLIPSMGNWFWQIRNQAVF